MGHYFQKWGTIIFSPGIRFGAAISEGAQFHPVWDYIILYVKRGGVAVGPLGPPIVSGPRCQTGCCLHRRRFAQKRQKDPVGSCREGFCEMPSTPSTPSGTGNPLGFCSVEESTGGRGGSPGLVYLASHLSVSDRCEANLTRPGDWTPSWFSPWLAEEVVLRREALLAVFHNMLDGPCRSL